jgi:Fur family transcriptional regulator, ferric uptake regulator
MEKGECGMEKKITEIMNLIKARGYKFTRTREIIVRLFVETDRHLKPEEVYQLVKHQGISLPTVYRNIDVLTNMGIIKELSIHNERYYELYLFSQKKMHMHFKCSRCGLLKEYNDQHVFKEMILQRDYIEENYKDSVEDITIIMNGVCSQCLEEKEALSATSLTNKIWKK